MTTVTLSASSKGNGYQATIAFSDVVSISSAEAFPSIGEAVAAAATKLLEMPDRLTNLARPPLGTRRWLLSPDGSKSF